MEVSLEMSLLDGFAGECHQMNLEFFGSILEGTDAFYVVTFECEVVRDFRVRNIIRQTFDDNFKNSFIMKWKWVDFSLSFGEVLLNNSKKPNVNTLNLDRRVPERKGLKWTLRDGGQ